MQIVPLDRLLPSCRWPFESDNIEYFFSVGLQGSHFAHCEGPNSLSRNSTEEPSCDFKSCEGGDVQSSSTFSSCLLKEAGGFSATNLLIVVDLTLGLCGIHWCIGPASGVSDRTEKLVRLSRPLERRASVSASWRTQGLGGSPSATDKSCHL